MADVAVFVILIGTPRRFDRLDMVGRARHLVGPAHRIKNKELSFWPKVSRIPCPGRLEIGFSAFGDGTGIPVVALHGRRFDHVTAQQYRGVLHEGIDDRCSRVRHQNHV